MKQSDLVDIIIPSYNARHLLEKNLPHVIKNTSNLGKIIIIDNGSTDDTVSWLEKNHPKIIIVKNSTNLGFTKPVNQGVAFSHSKYFVLLNNDVRPEKDYLGYSYQYFQDPNMFAVTFNEKNSSWPMLTWHEGKMQFTRGEDKSRAYYSGWASGGSAIFNRRIWDKLGGLDEIYAPWYWEDIDIGYRSWKSGYKIVWEPRCLVIHDHESTSKTLDQNYVNLIKQRNELLFNWLNVKDGTFVFRHFIYIFLHSLKHPGYLKVILAALSRIFLHRPLKRKFIVSDSSVFKQFSKPV